MMNNEGTDKKLVFVYGSLLSGLRNHSIISQDETSELLQEWETPPAFTMVDLGAYPAVIPTGNGVIKGEIWAVSDATWERIEWLEGYPSYYDRTWLTTPLGEAAVYILPREYASSGVVRSGDWRSYYCSAEESIA